MIRSFFSFIALSMYKCNIFNGYSFLVCLSLMDNLVAKKDNKKILEYFLYILIYILLFLLDDIIIYVVAMTTLEITGISTKYTKYSHLIGGIIMLLIGILMIFKPEWIMFNF